MHGLTLDALLVEAAAAAGADVRTGCRVTGVLADETGRLTGVDTITLLRLDVIASLRLEPFLGERGEDFAHAGVGVQGALLQVVHH